MHETLQTLKFAQRAKTIKNKVKLNEEKSVGELNAIITALKKEVEGLQAYSVALEKALTEAGGDPSTVKVEKGGCLSLCPPLPLPKRLDPSQVTAASTLLAHWPALSLAHLLWI